VLAQPDTNMLFDVYRDASSTGLAGVLMQDGRVISYSSRQLWRHEEHYSTHDLALAAVVMTLWTWHHYLHGNVVHIYMDHKSLKYIFTQLDLNMRKGRWLELIKDYIIADVLSHKAHCNWLLAVRLTGEEYSIRVFPNLSLFNITIMQTLRDEIVAAQKNDEGMDHIKHRMKEGDPKVTCFHKVG
jgi:hypothetical protein